MKTLLTLALIAAPLTLSSTASAQDYEDLDGEGGSKSRNKKQKAAKNISAGLEDEVVREINRGFYLKTGLGATAWILAYGSVLRPGTVLSMGVGSDFVDQEDTSMAWEVNFAQGVHNGLNYEQQAAAGIPATSLIQGDTRTFALEATYEYSRYLTRRIGVGARVGGGVMLTPLLMDPDAFQNEVIPTWNAQPTVHNNPHPYGTGGATFEYYTKLTHFSIGVDIMATYAVGFDLGAGGQGYLKYTF